MPDAARTRLSTASHFVLLSVLCCTTVSADDIDLYTAQFANQLKPNVLFVLDYSGSMNDDVYGNDPTVSGLTPKIDILKTALSTVLDENLDTINAGIGSIFSGTASGNRWPVSELNADAATVDPDIPAGLFTVRDIIGKQIEQVGAYDETRTVSGLAAAALYLKGGPVLHDGRDLNHPPNHQPGRWDAGAEGYRGGSHYSALALSYTPADTAYAIGVNEPGNYDFCYDTSATGGVDGCAGKPFYDCYTYDASTGVNAEGDTVNYGGFRQCKVPHPDAWRGAQYVSPITQSCQATAIVLISDGEPTRYADTTVLQEVVGNDGSTCEDLSESIFTAGPGGKTEGNCGPEIVKDLATNDQVSTVPGSTVKTYTVGFDVDGPGKRYLQRIAQDGEGSFFEANAADELNAAIREAINEIAGGAQSFTQFSIDVNKATFSHDNRVFFSLFSPNSGPAWTGNLKGYFIGPDGITDTLEQPAIETVDGKLQFSQTARSFWSTDVDGNEVMRGGASEIVSAQVNRKLYTYLEDVIPPSGVNLAGSADHALGSENALITAAMMGLSSGSSLRETSLDWLKSAPMGDPLHTVSLRVDYDSQTVLFTMTNQGLLHAIDASSPRNINDHTAGEELFAFMPKRLLANLPKIVAPVAGSDHIYGLDGGLTRWHTDTNGDGIVNSGEKLLLVFGMRRGGDAYYALDVSNPSSPSLEWKIDSTTAGFANLAQSWSKPSLVSVNDGGVRKRMMVFGGGYDAATLDDTTVPTPSAGNAIYMIDESGNLRWSVTSALHADLNYAIAANLTVLDIDNDGAIDRIYAGDLGGQVWRVDLDDITATPVVSRFADFSSSGFHPFFYAPSVAAARQDGNVFLSVTLGSGNRTDPLNELSNNSLFMMRDQQMEPMEPASIPPAITLSDLYDATSNDIGSSDPLVSGPAKEALELSNGWKIDFAQGEKALARVVTFEDTVMATTFSLNNTSTDPCALDTMSQLYTVNLKTGEPVKFLEDGSRSEQTLTADERTTELDSGGIPSSPVVVFRSESGSADVYVDRQKVSFVAGRLRTIYWHAR